MTNVMRNRFNPTVSKKCSFGCDAAETQHHLLSCSQRMQLWTTRHNRVAYFVMGKLSKVDGWHITNGDQMVRGATLTDGENLIRVTCPYIEHYKPDTVLSVGNIVVIIDYAVVNDHQLNANYKEKMARYKAFKEAIIQQQEGRPLVVKRVPYIVGQLGYICPYTVRKAKAVFTMLRDTSKQAPPFLKELPQIHKAAATKVVKFISNATGQLRSMKDRP
jgi:hypothetical protein